jgi:hypothetical protein
MLMTMPSYTEDCRAMATVAAAYDAAHQHRMPMCANANHSLYEFMVPGQGYSTEMSQSPPRWAFRLRSGMGFIERRCRRDAGF